MLLVAAVAIDALIGFGDAAVAVAAVVAVHVVAEAEHFMAVVAAAAVVLVAAAAAELIVDQIFQVASSIWHSFFLLRIRNKQTYFTNRFKTNEIFLFFVSKLFAFFDQLAIVAFFIECLRF